jgi:antitoxin HigA-1
MRKVLYPHPGEILLEEFLKPMGITQYRLAKEIGVPQRRIGEIVAGARGVTADTGLRLARFFGMSEDFWIGLQVDFQNIGQDSAVASWGPTTGSSGRSSRCALGPPLNPGVGRRQDRTDAPRHRAHRAGHFCLAYRDARSHPLHGGGAPGSRRGRR